MCDFRWEVRRRGREGGGGQSKETDRTKGCEINVTFLSLSNGRAEVVVGECGAFVNKQREGNGVIKFISSHSVFS